MPIPKFFTTVLVAAVAVVGLSACSETAKDTHPDQPVTKRKAIFKQFTKTLEPMGMVARGRKDYNPREFNINALELQKLTSQPWILFTADSNYPPTLAKPAVWEKPAEFQGAQDKFQVTIKELVEASQGSDLDRIKAAVNSVQNSCKTCHDQFRNES